MSEAILYQAMSAIGTVVATGYTFSRIFFNRVETLESNFLEMGRKVNEKLAEVDKSLAVNSTLIDQILTRDCQQWASKKHKS